MIKQVPNYHDRLDIENPTLRLSSGHFQAKADLQTGNVTGSNYNTKPKVTFNYPQDTQTSHENRSIWIPRGKFLG